MIDDDRLEQRLKQLGEQLAPDSAFADAVLRRVSETQIARPSRLTSSFFELRRKPGRLVVAACAVALAVLWIWPFGDHAGGERWWLAPSSAAADEISNTLEQAQVDGIVARSTTTLLMKDGTWHTSSTVSTYFFRQDRYRLDIYDNQVLREIQWYVPEGDELVQTAYRLQDGSIDVVRHRPEKPVVSPISELLRIVRLIDQADRRLEPREIEGRRCVGFEISADKVGVASDAGTYQVWFDAETKQPVLLEFERPVSSEHFDRIKTSFDRFEWNPRLPADTFAPHPVPDPAALQQR